MMEFEILKVRLTLKEPILGTVPKDPEVYKNYIQSKSPRLEDDETDSVPVASDELEKKGWTGFHTDKNGVFLFDYQILGFFKEAGNCLKEQLGIKNLRSKIDMFVFVEPRRIYIAKEPAGYIERPLRGQTMQGPRVTLVRSDYVPAGTSFEITIKILKNKEIDKDVICNILEYGELRGLGQFRNGGYGRFTFEVIEEDTKQKKTS